MNYVETETSVSQLLLDPNNYRFHDIDGYNEVKRKARFHEPGVQSQAIKLLRDTTAFDLGALKDSIRTNGFIPIEKIVVVPYSAPETQDTYYLVIEGNRRTAALKILIEENNSGAADLADKVVKSIERVSVVVLNGTDEEIGSYQRTLMAIRHVAGIREWGPYQQAKLVVEMFEEEGATLGSVAQKIGISSKEVARRYRASKALKQMEEDEEFGEFAEPRLYSFFHEAVSQPKVRDWLGFNNETYKAENDEARQLFFELLSPREVDGARQLPKLTSANQQVRQLKDIVSKPRALEVLADPDKTFEDAVITAREGSLESKDESVESYISVAIAMLKKPGFNYAGANDRAKELWSELLSYIDQINKIIPK